MLPAAHASLWEQYYRVSMLDIDPGALEREMPPSCGLACINALGRVAQDARRFFDALLRDVVNALQNLNALEALGPVACAFARQVHPPVQLQQAPSCCSAQRATAAA